MTKIIGISGISGAGKTTLVNHISSLLEATVLFWDDFDAICESPDDYLAWHESGADYSAWKFDPLAKILDTLKQGQTATCPITQASIQPNAYIVVDAPLGRMHEATGKYLDLAIHIDTPLDVALARRILRDYLPHDKSKLQLLDELNLYLNHVRKLFADDAIKNACDLVIDGTLPIEAQAKIALEKLKG